MRIRVALVCVVAAVAVSGCANKNKQTASTASTNTSAKMVPVNTVCPIGGDEFGSAPSETRSYKGTTIGFCCDHCSGKFDKMSDTEKENVVNLAKTNKVVGH